MLYFSDNFLKYIKISSEKNVHTVEAIDQQQFVNEVLWNLETSCSETVICD